MKWHGPRWALDSKTHYLQRSLTKKWFPYNKGGEFRKWYGNNEYVVNWENDGEEIKAEIRRKYPQLGDDLGWKITNESITLASITWSFVSSSYFGVRTCTNGFFFDVGGSSTFPTNGFYYTVAGFLCLKVCFEALKCLNPTLNVKLRILLRSRCPDIHHANRESD